MTLLNTEHWFFKADTRKACSGIWHQHMFTDGWSHTLHLPAVCSPSLYKPVSAVHAAPTHGSEGIRRGLKEKMHGINSHEQPLCAVGALDPQKIGLTCRLGVEHLETLVWKPHCLNNCIIARERKWWHSTWRDCWSFLLLCFDFVP